MNEGVAGAVSEDQRRLLARATEDVARIARMAQDMLAVSRVRAGTVRIAARRVDLAELARDVARSRQREAAGRGVELGFLDAGEQAWCHADPDLLTQALTNLVVNAVKATPSGGSVSVAAGRLAGDVGEPLVQMTVRDTGPGLSALELDQLLRAGKGRGGSPGRSGYTGLGIGLSIVREILEQHGGQLAVESAPGDGSCFRMVVPSDFRRGERWLVTHVSEAIRLARAVGAPLSVVEVSVDAPHDAEAPWASGRGLLQLPLVEQCLEEGLRPTDAVFLTERAATLLLYDTDGRDARGAARRSVVALGELLSRLPEPYSRSTIGFGVGSYPEDGEGAADVVQAARRELGRGRAKPVAQGKPTAVAPPTQFRTTTAVCLASASGAADDKHGG
jgi:hypothetical protein